MSVQAILCPDLPMPTPRQTAAFIYQLLLLVVPAPTQTIPYSEKLNFMLVFIILKQIFLPTKYDVCGCQ